MTTVRIDAWTWAVRLFKSRTVATAACRAGHVQINGERAKPAHQVSVGDRIRIRGEGLERVVEVHQIIAKRVSAERAAQCYIDHSPPRPPRAERIVVGERDRGAGRPTKRDRRQIDRFRGR